MPTNIVIDIKPEKIEAKRIKTIPYGTVYSGTISGKEGIWINFKDGVGCLSLEGEDQDLITSFGSYFVKYAIDVNTPAVFNYKELKATLTIQDA